jgi:hypothetical protein
VYSSLTCTLKWQPNAYCASGSPISAASTNNAAALFPREKGKYDHALVADMFSSIFMWLEKETS